MQTMVRQAHHVTCYEGLGIMAARSAAIILPHTERPCHGELVEPLAKNPTLYANLSSRANARDLQASNSTADLSIFNF